jgi:nicotinate-nucleotide adenylyltransferase
MRVAFFGGTFDPPHCGHLAIARAAGDRLRLDKVLFAPVGNQPLKQDSSIASFEDRVAMVRLAIADDARFEISTVDAPRPDGQPNYTIDTILRLKDVLTPHDSLFCLVGADSFVSLPHWYRAAELLLMCDFIVAGRPGAELPGAELPDAGLPAVDAQHAECVLPQGVRMSDGPHTSESLRACSLTNDSGQHSTLYFLPDLNEDVSATSVRAALAEHSFLNDALPAQVAEYIRARHLYS